MTGNLAVESGGPTPRASKDFVLYSFFHKWEKPLRDGLIRVFFRKRFPSKTPRRVYFYIGSPAMSVIGSAKIEKIETLTKHSAQLLASHGHISIEELNKYIGSRDSVGAIHISDFQFFSSPIHINKLTNEIGLLPPQNFQKLSFEERELIERISNDL